MTIDVAINVYGKPFQTAVALLSLEKHSGKHINKIYFAKEQRQPGNISFEFLYDLLAEKIIVYTPSYWNGWKSTDTARFDDTEYRRSLRYQYAWEESNADYLFVTHNDVLYSGDIIGKFVGVIGQNAAVGEIGQCWNCPAFSAGVCNGDHYLDFKPTHEELLTLYNKYPTKRVGWERFVDEKAPWPLPECRVNEWAALINLSLVKQETLPFGDSCPFGCMTLDVGTQWFRDMALKGYGFVNHPLEEFASHGWVLNGGGGHQALFEYDKYEQGEAAALSMLVTEYELDEKTLVAATGGKWRTRIQSYIRKLRQN